MRNRELLRSFALLVFTVVGICSVRVASADEFAHLHALIKPKAEEEKWAQIPWMDNLWEARKQAAAIGKPLLLWEMDGHPLGCT